MNRTYIAMTMNREDLNIGNIYFTDAFLNDNVVNPVTQQKYTEEEKKNLTAADIEAPVNGVIAVSDVKNEKVLWFDKESALKIVSHADPLFVKDNTMVTMNGEVIAVSL